MSSEGWDCVFNFIFFKVNCRYWNSLDILLRTSSDLSTQYLVQHLGLCCVNAVTRSFFLFTHLFLPLHNLYPFCTRIVQISRDCKLRCQNFEILTESVLLEKLFIWKQNRNLSANSVGSRVECNDGVKWPVSVHGCHKA